MVLIHSHIQSENPFPDSKCCWRYHVYSCRTKTVTWVVPGRKKTKENKTKRNKTKQTQTCVPELIMLQNHIFRQWLAMTFCLVSRLQIVRRLFSSNYTWNTFSLHFLFRKQNLGCHFLHKDFYLPYPFIFLFSFLPWRSLFYFILFLILLCSHSFSSFIIINFIHCYYCLFLPAICICWKLVLPS